MFFVVVLILCQCMASKFYYPTVRFETFGSGRKIAHLASTDIYDHKRIGLEFLMEKLHLDESDLAISNSFVDHRGCHHLYVTRLVNGLEITNHRAQIHLKEGRIIGYSTSFDGLDDLEWKKKKSQSPNVTPEIAVQIASDHFKIPHATSSPVKRGVLQLQDGKITLVFIVLLQNATEYLQVSVQVSSGIQVQHNL